MCDTFSVTEVCVCMCVFVCVWVYRSAWLTCLLPGWSWLVWWLFNPDSDTGTLNKTYPFLSLHVSFLSLFPPFGPFLHHPIFYSYLYTLMWSWAVMWPVSVCARVCTCVRVRTCLCVCMHVCTCVSLCVFVTGPRCSIDVFICTSPIIHHPARQFCHFINLPPPHTRLTHTHWYYTQ